MRKVIGIGETILDIIFQNDQVLKAVPGGSVFNCLVSLGRCRIPVSFVSEVGNDKVGDMMKRFMRENGLSTDYIYSINEGSSPVSMAFLDENQQAEYQFYTDYPEKRLPMEFPEINENDILVIGSYFAVNPALRESVSRLIREATSRKAMVYYDINFRKAHVHERELLRPLFFENFSHSTLVRCSDEDLETLFPGETVEVIYKKQISPYCRNFVMTKGAKTVFLKTARLEKTYPVEAITPVSTIGAGDNFNAGLIYGIMREKISSEEMQELNESQWDKLILYGMAFAREVCLSPENYVTQNFLLSLPQLP
jgi:fructokinase